MSAKTLLSLYSLLLLSACGWVDSTGREANSVPVTQISFNDGQQSEATQINEQSSLRIRAESTDIDGTVSTYRWSDQPVQQGALSECEAIGGDFDMSIAANSLEEACASTDSCSVLIEKQSDSPGEVADFIVSAPDLRAPIGLTYELTAIDNEGGVGVQRSTFCLIAINAAPEAVEDTFTVLEGESLDVTINSARTLLSNDSDDNHVLNQPLTVLTTPKRAPGNAASFELRGDGGFRYTPNNASLSSDTSDSFEYSITDGVHDPVSARVNILIVAKDDPPVQKDEIPALVATPGIAFQFDLDPMFEDPEGGDISFAVVGGSLPPSGSLSLSSTGVLSGTTQQIDTGAYSIDVAASDGNSGIVSKLNLSVGENLAVITDPIEGQVNDAGEEFVLNVSQYFKDPENQPLRYSVDTTFDDADLSINESTGVLRGVFKDGGRFTIDVSADDGISVPATIRFAVTVNLDNGAPRFRGAVASQTLKLGEELDPNSGSFSDPDDDKLEYSIIGDVPPGVTIDSTGLVKGTPTRVGRFAGLRIVATDPYGEFARSNPFAITVLEADSNSAPGYVNDTVFNQDISLRQFIEPVRPKFIDPDGDELTYSITGGELPDGVSIDVDTGVVSGRPLKKGWEIGLQVVATDPDGASDKSEAFWIRVR